MAEDNGLGVEFKYLIVNDMDRKFGLWVNTVGYQSIPPDSPYPLKEHPSGYFFNAEKGRVLREYQLVYITKGRGLFSSDSTSEKQVCKGRLMVLFPGQWHTYRPLRQTVQTLHFFFAPLQPAGRTRNRIFDISALCHTRWTLVKCHGNRRSEV